MRSPSVRIRDIIIKSVWVLRADLFKRADERQHVVVARKTDTIRPIVIGVMYGPLVIPIDQALGETTHGKRVGSEPEGIPEFG